MRVRAGTAREVHTIRAPKAAHSDRSIGARTVNCSDGHSATGCATVGLVGVVGRGEMRERRGFPLIRIGSGWVSHL